ncbi:hypothetical protein BD289DRAFT_230503 [Coniella lustricola]|uniref:Uncharacterized protein n=1 Tax=Coniella lustricola TaxID=2025994 RepID=A0A2T3AAA3_9PEZI|nr:hypothetical protein BD289DRAFT_230503 [Coniella lustricola]
MPFDRIPSQYQLFTTQLNPTLLIWTWSTKRFYNNNFLSLAHQTTITQTFLSSSARNQSSNMSRSNFTPLPAFALATAHIRPRNDDGGSSIYSGSVTDGTSRPVSMYSGRSTMRLAAEDLADYASMAIHPSTLTADMDLGSLGRSASWTSAITPEPSTAAPSREGSQRTIKKRSSVRISSSLYSTHSCLDVPEPELPGCGSGSGSDSDSSSSSSSIKSPTKPKTAVERTQDLLHKVSNQWITLRDVDLPARYRAQWASDSDEIKRRCKQRQVHSHERQFEISHSHSRLRRCWLRTVEGFAACRSPEDVKLARRAKKLQKAYVKEQNKWREETLAALLATAPDPVEAERYLRGVHGDFLRVNLELDLEPIAGKSTRSRKARA